MHVDPDFVCNTYSYWIVHTYTYACPPRFYLDHWFTRACSGVRVSPLLQSHWLISAYPRAYKFLFIFKTHACFFTCVQFREYMFTSKYMHTRCICISGYAYICIYISRFYLEIGSSARLPVHAHPKDPNDVCVHTLICTWQVLNDNDWKKE